MDKWEETLISPDLEIYKAMEVIDRNSQQIAIVTDGEGKLLGTVTDGDIRRGILKEIPLSSPVSQIMNPHPITIPRLNNRKSIIKILKANKVRHLPVIDEARHVIGVERLDRLLTVSHNSNSWVVIMAGGRGKRLRPLTDDCPKPMLKVGEKPVLQTILEQFVQQGFTRFCISVNYKAEQIKDYFGDGSEFGAEIHYIDEKKWMGTAGSLSLFPFETSEPILILNGDILTKLSFEQLVDFHRDHQAKATIAVTTYDYQVPYGVIKANRDRLAGFEEKPVVAGFINAGIYVLNPEVLSCVPRDSYFDMNRLFEILLQNEEPVCIFPIREYWTDIGGMKSYYQACQDYDNEFN
jgi:dTDP-glucose pyrophosphorylase